MSKVKLMVVDSNPTEKDNTDTSNCINSFVTLNSVYFQHIYWNKWTYLCSQTERGREQSQAACCLRRTKSRYVRYLRRTDTQRIQRVIKTQVRLEEVWVSKLKKREASSSFSSSNRHHFQYLPNASVSYRREVSRKKKHYKTQSEQQKSLVCNI